MPYEPEKHGRHSIRLPGFDYFRPGFYFITLCISQRRCIFGEIADGEMRLNKIGLFVAEQSAGLPNHYQNVNLDAFVIMPNHVHGIIQLLDREFSAVGAGFRPAEIHHHSRPNHGLSEIIRGFKTYTARIINKESGTPGKPVWQHNYYEHVVRTENDLDAIRRYILENPLKWELDPENPAVRENVSAERGGLKTRAYGGR